MRWLQLSALVALCALALADVDVTCSAAFCKSYVEKTGCPKLPAACTDANLAAGLAMLMPSPTHCNCCDFCITYLVEGDACVIGGTSQNVPVCGPGLGCVKGATTFDPSTCKLLDTPCTTAQRDWDKMREEGTLGFRIPRPECDAVGDFIPAHCVPGATCYCVSPDNERIFGELPYITTDTPNQMTCSCSVSGWHARQALGDDAVVSRCRDDGRFDALQCIDSKCFCVDIDNGHLDGTAWIMEPDLAPDTLKCFDPSEHATGTFRKPCETERFEIEQTLALLALEGVTGLGLKPPRCDADGKHAKLQETTATWYCVDPEGHRLENFEVAKTKVSALDVDCNCARTRYALLSAPALMDVPTCCASGSFQRWQCLRQRCYCVDRHGNQLGLEKRYASELECYDENGPCVGLE